MSLAWLHSHVLSDWCVADSVCRSGETSLAAVGAAATAVQAGHVHAVQVIVRCSRPECGRSLIAILLLRPSDKLAQVKHAPLGRRGGQGKAKVSPLTRLGEYNFKTSFHAKCFGFISVG